MSASSVDSHNHLALGTVFGLASAIGYTAANTCLRAASDYDPIWVSAVKAVPTILFVGPWVLLLAARGRTVLPQTQVVVKLILAGLVGQLGGNVLFQWSLGVIGMALTVPLALGTIILGGALLGRVFLGEPLTIKTLISTLVLIVAIFVLSLGADDAHRSVVGPDVSLDPWKLTRGVAAAAASGLAYSILGVVIRYGVTGRTTVSMTLCIISIVGIVSLGTGSLWRIGWEGMLATDGWDFQIMLLAGLFNAAAFLAITRAFQLASVVYVNALNTTQAAMAAVAGVFFFQESLSAELGLGILLTITGLLLMRNGRRSKPPRSSSDRVSQP
jgi:drug/metabolite transporter (DMT)-like permease